MTARGFSHPMWNKKTRKYFKPTYFDNTTYGLERRWDQQEGNWRYKTQDPLFFDYEKIYLNGGIQPYVDKVRAMGKEIPVNKRAYILYHMAKQDVYDPEFYSLMETGLMIEGDSSEKKQDKNVSARYAMAGVCAYWRSGCGSSWALKYWETYLEDQAMDLHVDDVIELCQAFKENRTHHRDYMRDYMNRLFKKDVILAKWNDEVEYHQKRLKNLMIEMDDLQYYD